MMKRDYAEKLKRNRNDEKNKRDKSNSLDEMMESVKSELEFYESFIPDFFSKNGDEQGIKKIYKELKKNSVKTKNYNEYVDIPKAYIIYSEYEQGMLKFLSEIMESGCEVTESTRDKINKKLDNAYKNDSIFIESIFGGKNNPSSTCVLEDAVSNIEYLIDFVPEIDVFRSKCIDLYEKAKISKTDSKLINDGCGLYFEAVSDYCYNVLNSVLTSYLTIQEMVSDNNDKINNTVPEIRYAVF